MVYLLGTIFSCRLIHTWQFSEYLWQQDGVCEIESKTTVPMFIVMSMMCKNVANFYVFISF